jgi:hypothetical protein
MRGILLPFHLYGRRIESGPETHRARFLRTTNIGKVMNPNVNFRGTKLISCPKMVGNKFPIGQTCVHKQAILLAPEIYVLRGNFR